jgi:hypothetical protein
LFVGNATLQVARLALMLPEVGRKREIFVDYLTCKTEIDLNFAVKSILLGVTRFILSLARVAQIWFEVVSIQSRINSWGCLNANCGIVSANMLRRSLIWLHTAHPFAGWTCWLRVRRIE